jgi:hypothetical protein
MHDTVVVVNCCPLFVSHFELGGFLLVESGEGEVKRALKKSLKKEEKKNEKGEGKSMHLPYLSLL